MFLAAFRELPVSSSNAGSVIRGSGLRQYERSHEGGHHLYCYGGGQDCAYWGIDVSGVCDYWEFRQEGTPLPRTRIRVSVWVPAFTS